MNQYTIGLGMANLAYKENPSTLQSTSGTTTSPYAGTASVLPLIIQYEMAQNESRSYYIQAFAPLLTAGKDNFIYGGVGANFYFKSFSSEAEYNDASMSLKIIPKWRYYWGIDGGVGYLIYTTTTAKKSDMLVEIGAHAGVIYSVNEKYTLKIEPGFARAISVQTSSTDMKLFLGLCKTIH